MFMDRITIGREALEEVLQASGLIEDPPSSLLAFVSWEEDDGQVTAISVWETASDRGQYAADTMMPLFEQGVLGEQHGSPHPVRPVHVHLRD